MNLQEGSEPAARERRIRVPGSRPAARGPSGDGGDRIDPQGRSERFEIFSGSNFGAERAIPSTLPDIAHGVEHAAAGTAKATRLFDHPRQHAKSAVEGGKSTEVVLATGVVKWFNAVTGYGMIQPDDGSQVVFVDIGAVERAALAGLRKGQKLAFDVVLERGRTAATNLKLLEAAEGEGPTARS